jgi:hypothetical protein
VAGEDQTQVPEVLQLSVNFRSHNGILRPANAVIETIIRLFPGWIDELGEERGAFDGSKPLLLPDKEVHMLSRFVKLTMGTQQSSPIAFGANQVVIVRTAEAKERLPAEFRECLVLTVPESKGLEFNDVLLYNFFAGTSLVQNFVLVYQHTKFLVCTISLQTRTPVQRTGQRCSQVFHGTSWTAPTRGWATEIMRNSSNFSISRGGGRRRARVSCSSARI